MDQAIKQADKAYSIAEEIGNKEWMAIALQKEAFALINKGRKVKSSRKKAKEKLEKSLALLTASRHRTLRIESLKKLKWLADMDYNRIAAIDYTNQIKEIKQILSTSAANQVLEEKTEELEEKTEELEEKKEELEEKKEELEEKTENLEEKTENLFSKVSNLHNEQQALKEQIDTLTQTQLEAELLIALQKNKMDALEFERELDSLVLTHGETLIKEQQAQLKLRENELQLQESQRNLFLALAAMVFLISIGLLLKYLSTKKTNTILTGKNKTIEEERQKSEQLLLNILPVMVANELKVNGVAKARKYEEVTVFFSDFVNFSGISRDLSPEKIVTLLDYYFKAFDNIIGKYNLEKIKTIGDAYMCVGGLPKTDANHAKDVVNAALEIQTLIAKIKQEKIKTGEPFFEARIGIHTGPLVAGVVGNKKFAFDVWGDTVNVAAKLEEESKSGKINISDATYQLIEKNFDCKLRGKIPIKNRGEIKMYFVNDSISLPQGKRPLLIS